MQFLPRFSFSIKTMGCKANIYDSLVLEKELTDIGGTRNDDTPDVFILNSCTVTAQADKQSHYEINTIKAKSPHTWSIATGCYAEVGYKQLSENRNIENIIQNKSHIQKAIIEKFNLQVSQEKTVHEDLYWGQLPSHAGKTRAFLKIQEGCNDYCTYCIIPYARGKSRSIRMGHILAEINRLVDESNIQEVVLTGTNIADYGLEFESSLDDLVENILKQTKIQRLRLTSLDPSEVSNRLLSMVEVGGRLMPHFHISLQSANSRVLRAMKRHYREAEIIETLQKINKHNPEIYVGMDVITGFPSETLEEHEAAKNLLIKLPWTRLHVFPYSEREGTSALKIPNSVPVAERKRRSKELLELSLIRHKSFVEQYINRQINGVLFESVYNIADQSYIVGHSQNYLRVMVQLPKELAHQSKSYRNQTHNVLGLKIVQKPAQDWTVESSFIQP